MLGNLPLFTLAVVTLVATYALVAQTLAAVGVGATAARGAGAVVVLALLVQAHRERVLEVRAT